METTVEGKAFIQGDFINCCIGIKDGKISSIKKTLKKNIHYNFGNLEAENIGKITHRWANGGIGRRARFRT